MGIRDIDQLVQPKKSASRDRINPIIYAADFETSNFNTVDGLACISYMSCVASINFNEHFKDTDPFNSVVRRGTFRYPHELGDYFSQIYKESKLRRQLTLVYFHNLPFDMAFIKNFDVLLNFIQPDKSYSDGSNPWLISFGDDNGSYLQLRCSLKLLNRSIGSIGQSIGHPKLDYDYFVTRSPTDPLCKKDIDYCYRDCAIALTGICKEAANWEWIHRISDIPMTFTGFSRKNNKYHIDNKLDISWKYYCLSTFPQDSKSYDTMRHSYSGGYTHANAFFRGKILHNVHSFDIVSDYPAQSMQMEFPRDAGKYIAGKQLERAWRSLYRECINESEKDIFQRLKKTYELDSHTMFYGRFVIHNIKVKVFNQYNYMPLLSSSKVLSDHGIPRDIHKIESHGTQRLRDYVNEYRPLVDNGRILSWDECTIYATEVDIVNLLSVYDIESIIPEYIYMTTSTSGGGVRQLRERNILYANLKTVTKRIVNGEDINSVELTDLPATWSSDIRGSRDHKKTAKQYLRLSKSLLNAQYGIDATKLVFDSTKFDGNEFSNAGSDEMALFNKHWNSDEIYLNKTRVSTSLLRKMKSSYIVGTYITAYARRHLVLMTLLIFKYTPYTILYWDTDSIKCVYNGKDESVFKPILMDIVSMFNRCIRKRCAKNPDIRIKNNPWNIGTFDYEGTYDEFTALNSKRYMYTNNGELTATMSGVVQASDKIGIIYDYFKSISKHPFEDLCAIIWKTNTVFHQSISGRTYLDRSNQGKYIKEFKQYAGAVITNTDYMFSTYDFDTQKDTWLNLDARRIHYDIVSDHVFENPVNRFTTRVYACEDCIGIVYFNPDRHVLIIPCDVSKFKHGVLLSDIEEDISEL